VVQLYVRSGQLPTNVLLASRFGDQSAMCRFGCASLEDPHHIFVHCPAFQDLRDEYTQSLISDMAHSLCGTSTLDHLRSHVTHVVTHLFRDDDSWPLGSSLFYLGLLPPLLPTTCPYSSLSMDAHRLLTRVAHSCHHSAIRLAARIWGMVLRRSALHNSSQPQGLDVGSRSSALPLPPHLQHFLLL
jgi:hypothetical protein